MEESQHSATDNPSFLTSITVAGLPFGIIVFAISLISGYAMINSEPTGSLLSPVQLIGTLVCLVGAFGGMLATWHYANEYKVPVKLGKGALIGFLTGVVIILVTVILEQGWQLVDPDMTQKMIDSAIANIEASQMGDQQKQQTIDMIAEDMRSSIWSKLLMGIPMYGILNLITGMIGAAIFGKEDKF